ncbi:ATPase [Sulfodiicoccus acidiphilus]|uniref:ATPase n=1 Tax=Sulfodiicoccus acidiphilus TaxID=1670455 RepID=A0A348B6H4_9CREN|nr:AAA family ATPase [Sulfodiicoccus acidiphilus]BBD73776.1 ATPase [Sulfodiicoccus acidiphilus]GGT98270.1 ATPase [Sulfodiicoccus acidiphilus]
MRLTSFQATNFRGLAEVNLPQLEKFNVVVGYNGRGKTNLLSAVYLFLKNMKAGLMRATFEDPEQEQVLLWKDYDVDKPITLAGTVQLSPAEVARAIGREEPLKLTMSVRISYKSKAMQWEPETVFMNDRPLSSDGIRALEPVLDYVATQVDYVPIFDQVYFDSLMKRMAELNRSPINLKKYWYDFVNLVSKTVPEVKGIDFADFKKLVINMQSLPVYIDLTASGFQRVIMLLFVFWMSPGKLVLVEEPEVNMHPSLQYKILKLIRDWAEKDILQVITTTHSPYVLPLAQAVIVMERKENSSYASVVRLDDEVRSTMTFLGVSPGDLFFSNHILLTTGLVEPSVVKYWMAKVGADPEELGIKVYRLNSEVDLRLWRKLEEALNLRVVVVGDCREDSSGCVRIGREMESYFNRESVVGSLRRIGIVPEDRELRDLNRDELVNWLQSVFKRRGLNYDSLRERVGSLITMMDSVQVPTEVEVLANKIKTEGLK